MVDPTSVRGPSVWSVVVPLVEISIATVQSDVGSFFSIAAFSGSALGASTSCVASLLLSTVPFTGVSVLHWIEPKKRLPESEHDIDRVTAKTDMAAAVAKMPAQKTTSMTLLQGRNLICLVCSIVHSILWFFGGKGGEEDAGGDSIVIDAIDWYWRHCLHYAPTQL